jgi:hypothetical protein
MKELLEWMSFAGLGIGLFLYGLLSARKERKTMSHQVPSSNSKHN